MMAYLPAILAAIGALGSIAALVMKLFFAPKSGTEAEQKNRDEAKTEGDVLKGGGRPSE